MNPSIGMFLKVYNVKCEFKQGKRKKSFSQVHFLKSEYLLTSRSTVKVSFKSGQTLFLIPNVKLIEVKAVIIIFNFSFTSCFFDANFYYLQFN